MRLSEDFLRVYCKVIMHFLLHYNKIKKVLFTSYFSSSFPSYQQTFASFTYKTQLHLYKEVLTVYFLK